MVKETPPTTTTTVPAPSDSLGGDAAAIARSYGVPISGAPAISGTTNTINPIGVPPDYVPPAGHQVGDITITGKPTEQIWNTEFGFEKRTTPDGKPNPYLEGDQYSIPLTQPESIPGLQMELVALGFLDPKDVTAGRWDDQSAQAFALILAFANRTGMTVEGAKRYLIEQAQKNGTYGKVKKASQPPQVLVNPEDLRASYKNAAEQLTGADLSKGEEDKYLAYYRAQEDKAYAAQTAAQGGSYTQPMGSDAYIRTQHPDQVQNYNSASRLIEFYRMLGVAV